MEKDILLNSAKKLNQPSSETLKEYQSKREELVGKINQSMLNRLDLTKLIGEGNEEMMQNNHANHVRFMESMFVGYDHEVLTETVLWVFRSYPSHGFKNTYWPAQLDTWVKILKQELSEHSFNEIYPFYEWMIINQPYFIELGKI